MKDATAEDWVIARLIMVAADGGKNVQVFRSPEFMKSLMHLMKRVGFERMDGMFKAIRAERDGK